MTRYRIALATIAVAIVAAVLFTVVRDPTPPATSPSRSHTTAKFAQEPHPVLERIFAG